MEKFEKAKVITKVVWNSILIAFGTFFWIIGLTGFIEKPTFLVWISWGILCTAFVIPFVIQQVKDGAESGKREGANTYTARQFGNRVTVENNPLGGAIKGGIVGFFAGILGGPIVLPFITINRILKLIENIKILVDTKE